LLGSFPLNLASLNFGDLLNLTTSDNLRIWAGIDAGLTFGINLQPSTTLTVAPPAFAPSTSVTTTVVKAGGGSTSAEQTLTVHNANAGYYTLALKDPNGVTYVTGDIAFDASASDVQTALLAASDGGSPAKTISGQYTSSAISVSGGTL